MNNNNNETDNTNALYERIYSLFIDYSFCAVKEYCTLDKIKQLDTETKLDERIIWEINDKLEKRKNEYYEAIHKILNDFEIKYNFITITQIISEAKILQRILTKANLPLDNLLSMDEIIHSNNPLLSFIKQNSIDFFKEANAKLLERNKALIQEINDIKSVNKSDTII